ncbi:hypothetical protein [Bradyrhizobium sp. AS23.2]|uniref:hypothetical protein n=1 Tax=Bradyrhizobium sp. AS23.2 TaxID=1680155 RepID=UPI0014322CD2|nr:hypothetical protein [Bradyrhizobium sp. AS23.2]
MEDGNLLQFIVSNRAHAIPQRDDQFSSAFLQLNKWQAMIGWIMHLDLSVAKLLNFKPDLLKAR